MAWIDPKLDWDGGDGIMASDFNRIEGNARYLMDSIYNLDGSVDLYDFAGGLILGPATNGTNVTLDVSLTRCIARRLITVPAGHRIKVDRAYSVGDSAYTYMLTSLDPNNRVPLTVGTYLYANITGAIAEVEISVHITATPTTQNVPFYGSTGDAASVTARMVTCKHSVSVRLLVVPNA